MKLNADQTVAVSQEVYWQSMESCPTGLKLQLLSIGGIAMYGTYRKGDDFYVGWSPVPAIRKTEA